MKNYFYITTPLWCFLVLMFLGCEEPNAEPLNPVSTNGANVLIDGPDEVNPKNGQLANTHTSSCPGPELIGCRTRYLMAGQNHMVGTLTVYRVDGTNDYKVFYNMEPGCYLSEVHVYAGAESDIPKTRSGCPKIGNFPFKMEGLNTNSVCLDVGTFTDDEFIVSAHAVVNCNGTPFNGEETAWPQDKPFPGCNNWSTCLTIDCKEAI